MFSENLQKPKENLEDKPFKSFASPLIHPRNLWLSHTGGFSSRKKDFSGEGLFKGFFVGDDHIW
jgi:hypothetical protein